MSLPSQTNAETTLRVPAQLAVAGEPATAATGAKTQCELSIVIKALNEERNIARTLRAALAAVEGLDAEVILADSLSTDATVAIAGQFPVTIVQLVHGDQRCCGVGAQLGYQHARGQWILIIDGDMEVDRAWLLAAIRHLHTRPDLAGVGGVVKDINLDNIEFRARQLRKPTQPGEVDRLYGGGLYRRQAIEQVGYLTHRSLHACEELELGLRLAAAGWRMQRMDMVSIRHHGHTVSMWTLIRRRWRSRYVNGAGELLRASLWRPWFWRAVACQALPLVVIAWWATMLALAVAAWDDGKWLSWLAVVVLLPIATMLVKKRSIELGLYSILMWCVESAGLLRGLSSRPQDPAAPIDSRVMRMEPRVQARTPDWHGIHTLARVALDTARECKVADIYQDGTYLENNDGWHVADSPWKAQQVRRAIEANSLVFDTVAEVGCGAGEILAQLAAAYPDKTFSGYELAPQAYAMCLQRSGAHLHFHCASLLEVETRFDLLLCIDVFEHVEDYFGFLRALKAKAGYVIFHIPLDLSVQTVLRKGKLLRERQRVGHIQTFTRDTALATLEDCGYQVVDSFYTAGSINLPNLSWKARLIKLPRQLLFAMAPDWAVRVLGGYSLLVLAKAG